MNIPTPFPYQGSKRKLAPIIHSFFPKGVDKLIEPFCGAAAITIYTAIKRSANEFVINDLNRPLIDLWRYIVHNPKGISDSYEKIWKQQCKSPELFFYETREQFNSSQNPELLLYLLARIVKGAVRYNSNGDFNQSPDKRRLGMKPVNMRKNLTLISDLLGTKVAFNSIDYREVSFCANKDDLIYLDPPYQGTSNTRDNRYYDGVPIDEFTVYLDHLNSRDISYILSYDGECGDKKYGKKMPESLDLKHFYVNAGRSTQSTLLGRSDTTMESLYLSPALVKRLDINKIKPAYEHFGKQLSIGI